MPRYTLSTEELDTHLAAMGIDELCIPSTLGAPFINTDWNSDASTALSGRMISLGFENLFNGAGWSRGFILYATYDFAAGTEYETFATREDLEALQRGAMEDLIEVDGFHGFIRIQQSYFCMGTCTAYKVFVFPFESHYLAVAYDFGAFLAEADWESVFQDLKEGRYPAESQNEMAEMEQLVSGIQFVH